MLWDILTGWIDRDSDKFVYKRIDSNHVDRQLNESPLEAGRHYVRLRLSEMFLKKAVSGATAWYPAVHSLVRFDFGNQKQVEIPNIADSTRVGLQQTNHGDVIARNFALTPAMPFSGGLVSVSAALMAIKGQNYLNNFIGVLSNFANLLAVPQLSAALSIAKPLAAGIQELFGAGQGDLHLGLYETFGSGELKAGYVVAIRATEADVDPNRLWVVEDALREGDELGAGQHVPFTRFDYMLFRVEIFEERDDWAKLTYIDEPFQQAMDALQNDDEKKADLFIKTALRRAIGAPDLTEADQTRVVDALKGRYTTARDKLKISGLTEETLPSLKSEMKLAMSVHLALQKGRPTLEDLLEI